MNLLLDTHVLLWFMHSDERLQSANREKIEDVRNTVFVSAISAFEIAIKFRAGKLDHARRLVGAFESLTAKQGFVALHVNPVHSLKAGLFPSDHKDPFDCLLAAQSIVEGIPIMTIDARIRNLGAETVW